MTIDELAVENGTEHNWNIYSKAGEVRSAWWALQQTQHFLYIAILRLRVRHW